MANGRDSLTKGDLIVADRVLFPNKAARQTGNAIHQYQSDAGYAEGVGLIEWDHDRYIPTEAYIALSDALEGVK
ncbi:MAG: hypothetical protein ACXAEN_14330 [Candidatus Thorarchaeota archaeon]